MTKIAMRFVTPTDIPVGDALVAIRLSRSDYEEETTGIIMTRLEEFHTDADGFLQVDLLPATHLYHVTVYDTVQDIAIHHDFIVPAVEDPNTVLMLPDLIVPPDTVLSSMPYDEEALAKIIQAKSEAIAAAVRAKASADLAQGAIDSTDASAAIAEAAKVVIQAAEIAVDADAAEVRANTVLVVNYTASALQHKTDAAASASSANAAKQVALDQSAIATQAAAAAKISETNSGASNTAAQAASTASIAARDQAVIARNTTVTAKDETIAAKDVTVQKAAELASQLAAFNEIYIGKFAAHPTVDGNGNPLKVGAIYENTTEGKLYQFETDRQWHPYDEESQQQMNNALLSANSAAASAGAATAAKDAAEASKIAAQTAKTAAETAQTGAAASAVTATNSKDTAVAASATAVSARDTASQKAVDAAASAAAAAVSAATAADYQIQSDWGQTDTSKKDFIKRKPVLAPVATTGAKADVGLGNVDNTSDASKPVSTAQQAALDLKAPLASPAFTGAPTAAAPAQFDKTTRIATTKFAMDMGLRYSSPGIGVGPGASVTVNAATVGTWYQIHNSTSNLYIPVISEAWIGAAIGVTSIDGGTLNFPSGCVMSGVSTPVYTYFMGAGETAIFTYNGNGTWYQTMAGLTKVATVSAIVSLVKSNQSGYRQMIGLTAPPRSVVAGDIGSLLYGFQGDFAINLPRPDSIGAKTGDKITFMAVKGGAAQANITLTPVGGGVLYSQGQLASMVVMHGQQVELVSDGGGTWQVGISTARVNDNAEIAAKAPINNATFTGATRGATFVAPEFVTGIPFTEQTSMRAPPTNGAAGVPNEVLSMGVAGISGTNYAGRYYWETTPAAQVMGGNLLYKQSYAMSLRATDASDNAVTAPLLTVRGNGVVEVPGTLTVGVGGNVPTAQRQANDLQFTNTEWVNRRGVAFQPSQGIGLSTGTTALVAANIGHWIQFNQPGCTLTVGTEFNSNVYFGATFTVRAAYSGTIQFVGTGVFLPDTAGAVGSYTMQQGEVATFTSNGSGGWYVTSTGLSPRASANTFAAINGDATKNFNVASVNDSFIGGMKNRIINGDMRINQRGVPNGGSSVPGITLDRWHLDVSQAGKIAHGPNFFNVAAKPPGFPHYLGFGATAPFSAPADNAYHVQQVIEGNNLLDLQYGTAGAKTCTLSMWVYSGSAGTHSGAVYNLLANKNFVFTYNVPVANTWTFIVVSVPGDTASAFNTNNMQGLHVRLNLGSGANFLRAATGGWTTGNMIGVTGSVNMLAAGSNFLITGVQFEVGAATSFSRRSVSEELAMCQRYLEVGNAPRMYVGTNQVAGYGSVPYKVTKRSVASVTLTDWQYFSNGVDTTFTPTVDASRIDDFAFAGRGLVNWGGWTGAGTWTANAEL
jgi:hypothetical protein